MPEIKPFVASSPITTPPHGHFISPQSISPLSSQSNKFDTHSQTSIPDMKYSQDNLITHRIPTYSHNNPSLPHSHTDACLPLTTCLDRLPSLSISSLPSPPTPKDLDNLDIPFYDKYQPPFCSALGLGVNPSHENVSPSWSTGFSSEWDKDDLKVNSIGPPVDIWAVGREVWKKIERKPFEQNPNVQKSITDKSDWSYHKYTSSRNHTDQGKGQEGRRMKNGEGRGKNEESRRQYEVGQGVELDQILLRSFAESSDPTSYLLSRIATAKDLRDGKMSPPQMGGFFPRPDPNAEPGNTTVFLGNVSSTKVREEHIWPVFSVFGEIEYVKIPPRIGVAFVKYRHRNSAVLAVEKMQDFELFDCHLRVGWGKTDDKPSVSKPTKVMDIKRGMANLLGVSDVKAGRLMLAMTVLSRSEYDDMLDRLVDVGSGSMLNGIEGMEMGRWIDG
ncbi:hypothetical protein TREMEDRAFT_59139 [Tremella mesenterica DSM 1558]|uniref:uncharacterized protein n=1 Tax=Tremella mesenterica (strain ATCC 24925 / CBS 8224 / DSM 1558 / NBRC 9311 / NRRL Y-6157 / RJB 2259-6 / UBC 559-6) TaxID=578456 RepID=UPI0003F49E1A|nr:uncharacterized protein TREMEDRAFT_59139 [Tremella mesenterica DSM 1558]EIW72977.1 hypothetical protein TREMEDRAFT_59139 [Tremella mesenterica DSM 1558]